MDYQKLMVTGAMAFTAGLVMGIDSTFRKRMDYANLSEILLKEGVLPKEISKEGIELVVKQSRKLEIITPYLVGGISGFVSSIAQSSPEFIMHQITAIPATYAGYITGVGIRNIKNRRFRKDIDIFKDIQENPERARDYMPEEARTKFDQALSKLEKNVLAGEEINKVALETQTHVDEIGEILIPQRKLYLPALAKYIRNKFKETTNTATVQKIISDFYDLDLKSGHVKCGVLKNAMPKARVIRKQGDNLTIYDVNWKFLGRDDIPGIVSFAADKPELVVVKEGKWHTDYKEMARELISVEKNRTPVVMHADEDAPLDLQESVLCESMLTKLAQKHKDDSDRAAMN